ncbi:helix-turn-helix domain-containing protein [Nonomuraea bangladeshensis]|jgi:transcriptional regulator with XRE-family HTH domain|uniref:helix-turn-helix domain-containing protein n=1 Tax=Nonomuraea bangladeshensis TaxID=404385 RepID=UPI0031DE307E
MEPLPAFDTDPRAVGDRLRRLRQERGVSLSELAGRAGIGKDALAGVETGAHSPTLATLWAITAQLGVPIGAILDPPPEPRIMRGTAMEAELLEVFEDDRVIYELYRVRVPPGLTQTSPAHHEGVTEHVTVFTGTLSAGPIKEPLTAGPGDHISWRSDVLHGYRAHGPDLVRATLLMRYPVKP